MYRARENILPPVEKRSFMSIFNFLKKLKLPSFGDDFIQEPVEKITAEAPIFYGARVIYDPRTDPEILPDQEDQKEWDKNADPADPASGIMWINR